MAPTTILRKRFWPNSEIFIDLAQTEQITDGRVKCVRMAICNARGEPTTKFYKGESINFFYEFKILKEIGAPSGGLEFFDETGHLIHGKNSFLYQNNISDNATIGTCLRYHHTITLDIEPGSYTFNLGLSSADPGAYQKYCEGLLSYTEFSSIYSEYSEHCRILSAGSFEVRLDPSGKFTHNGLVNLKGNCSVAIVKDDPIHNSKRVFTNQEFTWPAVFHITHWKAGSQWIYQILNRAFPDLVVQPRIGEVQFLNWPVQVSKIYPTLYISKQAFDAVKLPENWQRFVIIRDLRDTLISAYFSFKFSHPILTSVNTKTRNTLQSLSFDDGLVYLMDTLIPNCARIQLSWLEAGEPLIRYEDLLDGDLEILEDLLLAKAQLPITRQRLHEVILACRFENLTKRPRGHEDITKHNRKGIAGDWRNHFTPRIKKAFKARFGGVLVATGYEKDLSW